MCYRIDDQVAIFRFPEDKMDFLNLSKVYIV